MMASPEVPRILLKDGQSIPQLGFGVWQVDDEKAPKVVGAAIDAGYRLIDTATNYGNEAGIGRTLKQTAAQPTLRDDEALERQSRL
jgi:2,5-diketo-D-gluconate reductase A